MFKYIFILMLGAAPAGAQQMFPGAQRTDVLNKAEKVKLDRQGEEIFARAFVFENSTAALYAVFESTSPARAAASYLRQGIYRRELLILFAIARRSGATFKALVKEREKDVSLRELALKNKSDLMKILREAEAAQKRVEIRAASMDISTAAFAADASSGAVQAAAAAPAAVETSSAAVRVPAPAAVPENETK